VASSERPRVPDPEKDLSFDPEQPNVPSDDPHNTEGVADDPAEDDKDAQQE